MKNGTDAEWNKRVREQLPWVSDEWKNSITIRYGVPQIILELVPSYYYKGQDSEAWDVVEFRTLDGEPLGGVRQEGEDLPGESVREAIIRLGITSDLTWISWKERSESTKRLRIYRLSTDDRARILKEQNDG